MCGCNIGHFEDWVEVWGGTVAQSEAYSKKALRKLSLGSKSPGMMRCLTAMSCAPRKSFEKKNSSSSLTIIHVS